MYIYIYISHTHTHIYIYIYIYSIYIYIYMFPHWPDRLGFDLRSNHTKGKKKEKENGT